MPLHVSCDDEPVSVRYFGTEQCRCKDADVRKYQKKISGPILDRIDLQVELDRLSTDERFSEISDGESDGLRNKVRIARERQRRRFDGKGVPFNAAIPGGHVKDYCAFSDDGFAAFRSTIEGSSLTTRSMDRLAKVARTVADLADFENVKEEHLEKAKSFVVGGMLRESFA